MRWTARGLVALMAGTVLSLTLAVGALTETADDEWVGTLLVARDELDKGLAQIDEELAAIPARIASDDFLVFSTESGRVVQVDLRVAEDYVSIAQETAGHPEIKQVLLDAIEKVNLGTFESVAAIAFVNDIENRTPTEVMAAVRLLYTQDVDDKREVYAAHQAKLKAEHADLKKLRDDIQAKLDELAAAADTTDPSMACSGDELGCDTPASEPDTTSGLWSTGTFDGDFEGWGITAYLEQDGTTITGTIEDKNGPLRIVAEEVSRNRVEGHYFGDVFWQVGRDDGTYGPESAPFDGCPESLDGTTQWGELTIVPTRQAFDTEPQVHLTIEARPCDEDWRSRPGYDNLNQWHVDGVLLPPLGFDWATTPVDPDHPWTGDWYVDLGSMRLDQQDDHLTGVILSPGGFVTFEADPMDPELAGDFYDPAVTMLGEWQGDAFGAWLAGFGDIPATWQCAEPKDGDTQWGQLLLQIGGYDRGAPDRIDVVWRPCDEAWMQANGYADDYDWWYDGQDMFTGWRLQPAAAAEE